MRTKPLTPWKPRDPFSASHLNEAVDILRAINLSGGGLNVRTLPNGTVISLPDIAPEGVGYFGVIHTEGPNGEADFTNEQYWVWIQYVVADKWGEPVDIDYDNPPEGFDLTNTVVPATNESERIPGGPAGIGTHSLVVGTPVLILPVGGRVTDAADTTAVQRFVFFTLGLPRPQYQYQIYQAVAQNKAAFGMLKAHPPMS